MPAKISRRSKGGHLLRHLEVTSYTDIFFKHAPLKFWDKLAGIVTNNILMKNTGSKKNPLKHVSTQEMVQFYGNTRGGYR